jgi:hypothetical protein
MLSMIYRHVNREVMKFTHAIGAQGRSALAG